MTRPRRLSTTVCAFHLGFGLEAIPEIAQLLVDAGTDVNATDDRGGSLLYQAILDGSPEIVRLLVDAGADVNATDDLWQLNALFGHHRRKPGNRAHPGRKWVRTLMQLITVASQCSIGPSS